MTLEEILNRQAVALERIANVLERQENAKEAVAPKTPAAPKAAPAKKLPPVKEGAPKVEIPSPEAINPINDVFPPAKAEVPKVAPVAKAEVPKVEVVSPIDTSFSPVESTAKEVTSAEVITALKDFAKRYDETQAYALLTSFKVKKVSELSPEQRQGVLDKIAAIDGMNL